MLFNIFFVMFSRYIETHFGVNLQGEIFGILFRDFFDISVLEVLLVAVFGKIIWPVISLLPFVVIANSPEKKLSVKETFNKFKHAILPTVILFLGLDLFTTIYTLIPFLYLSFLLLILHLFVIFFLIHYTTFVIVKSPGKNATRFKEAFKKAASVYKYQTFKQILALCSFALVFSLPVYFLKNYELFYDVVSVLLASVFALVFCNIFAYFEKGKDTNLAS